MDGLLKEDRFIPLSDSGSAWIPTLTNKQVSFDRGITIFLLILKTHLTKVGKIKIKPSYVQIPEIGLRLATIFVLIEHLAKTMVRDVGNRFFNPTGTSF
jgi:hypothetical protein